MRNPVLADEGGNLIVLEQLDRLGRVRDREPVDADDHRQEDVRMLGEPGREQSMIAPSCMR